VITEDYYGVCINGPGVNVEPIADVGIAPLIVAHLAQVTSDKRDYRKLISAMT